MSAEDFTPPAVVSVERRRGVRSNANRPRPRVSVGPGQVFWMTILGNTAEWSCCFSAIFTATRRAICL